jgi:hypothetical protein
MLHFANEFKGERKFLTRLLLKNFLNTSLLALSAPPPHPQETAQSSSHIKKERGSGGGRM